MDKLDCGHSDNRSYIDMDKTYCLECYHKRLKMVLEIEEMQKKLNETFVIPTIYPKYYPIPDWVQPQWDRTFPWWDGEIWCATSQPTDISLKNKYS